VDWGVEAIVSRADGHHPPRAADLGTGSGAIALALKARCPEARVVATDCSDEALRVAKSNATRLGLGVEFGLGSWYDGLRALASDKTDAGRFDVIVSNPPYIAAGDAHLAALRHEPRLALTPGGDGLSDLQHLVRHAPSHLLPGGWLLLEHGHDQADAVASMLAAAGFVERSMRRDLAGLPRHSGGRWLPRP
jgi:release factor glutamine methyltransferase